MENEELIHKYFQDTLTSEEQDQFDKLLKEDIDFKEQFEFENNVQQIIKDKERGVLKDKLQKFEKEIKSSSDKKFLFWKPLRIAASIAIILTAGWYFYTASFSIDTEKLYTANYEKYPNTKYAITRSSDSDITLEYRAFEAYEANNFQESIVLFTELKESKSPEYVDFYLAQSYLNNDQLDKAIVLFIDITTHKKEFSSESHWYLALAYLKNDKKEKAIKALENLIQDGGYKKVEATILLEKLQ